MDTQGDGHLVIFAIICAVLVALLVTTETGDAIGKVVSTLIFIAMGISLVVRWNE